MPATLDGEVAIVTGGASGIGRAAAIRLAEAGAAVVIGDLQAVPREGGTPTHEVIRTELGGRALHVDCDVTDPADRASLIAAADDLGGVSILLNNAGIFRGGAFLDVTPEDFDRMADVNLKSVFFMAQVAAASMAARNRGVIVNLSSVAGIQGAGGFTLYCATKGAVRFLTYALADELGPAGIRVNALHPGFIETSMTTIDVKIVGTRHADAYVETIPLRRAGTPDDVARAIVFLASGDADYITGTSLTIDGGRMRVS
jgi:NAD(P)-dependent dehydrogenase (short-subunit alcohol dehydrogenase family)